LILKQLLIVFCAYAPANVSEANYRVGLLEMKQTAMKPQSALIVPCLVLTSLTEEVACS
jgi:hypothetical protein